MFENHVVPNIFKYKSYKSAGFSCFISICTCRGNKRKRLFSLLNFLNKCMLLISHSQSFRNGNVMPHSVTFTKMGMLCRDTKTIDHRIWQCIHAWYPIVWVRRLRIGRHGVDNCTGCYPQTVSRFLIFFLESLYHVLTRKRSSRRCITA